MQQPAAPRKHLRAEIDATLDHWLRWRSGRFEDSAPARDQPRPDLAAPRADRLGRGLLTLCGVLAA